MNIVLPLGAGSHWQDNELRYCLRSIEKHLSGWEKIIIVGRLPDWIKQNDRLVFIPAKDKSSAKYKEENIHNKIIKAIDNGAGESFLFMNDDHFLMEDFEVQNFPYHHKGLLSAAIPATNPHNAYIKTLRATKQTCGDAFNYDTHCPIIYESAKYKACMPVKFPHYGYALKTMYCHRNKIEGSFYPDYKMGKIECMAQTLESIHKRAYFSIGNRAIGEEMLIVLNGLYPDPSLFE